MEKDPRKEPVLIKPGAFNRKLPVQEKVLLAILPPYVLSARLMAGSNWRKHRLDWGGLWNVPKRKGGFSIAGPCIGAPSAVTMLETLIANGCKQVIAVGCCGSLTHLVKIGDIVIPRDCLSEEGVSAHYYPSLFPPTASEKLFSALVGTASSRCTKYYQGTIWTTDAPYRETHEKVKRYSQQGILGVEMEMSALFTVGRFRGIEIAGVLAVSDELSSLTWKPGFLKPNFLLASKLTIQIAMETLKELKAN